jgi:hypothetical protein
VRNSTVVGRVAAVAAVAIAVIVVGVILLSGGTNYQVRLVFQDASQIVNGDQVQVAGIPVGSVSNIALTRGGQAQIPVWDREPLHRPAARPRERAEDPLRRGHRDREHDQCGGHRRVVQHAQPTDAEGAPELDPGRRLAVRGQGR